MWREDNPSLNGTASSELPDPATLNYVYTAPRMLAAAWTTWCIAFIFVCLRVYTRAYLLRLFTASDWCILASLTCALGMCVAYVYETQHGLGYHIVDVNMDVHFTGLFRAWWFSLLSYIASLGFTKISICLLYLRLFTIAWARKASYAVLGIVIISKLWGICATLTACVPLQAFWDPSIKEEDKWCHSTRSWWANTAMAVITDVLIFLVPIPMVVPLKLPRRQKFFVVGIFAIGVFICIVSFIRLAILYQQQNDNAMDITYNGTNLTYWTVIEVHTAIVIACLMTLKPLANKLFPGFLNDNNNESSSASSDPPLTIGSRPLRNQLAGQARPDSWVEITESNGRRIQHSTADDIEAQPTTEGKPSALDDYINFSSRSNTLLDQEKAVQVTPEDRPAA